MLWADLPPEPSERVVAAECERVYDEFISQVDRRTAKAMRESQEEAEETSNGPVFGGLRDEAMREGALALGAQQGLSFRYRQIDDMLRSGDLGSLLDQAFDFSRLVHNGILMPVVTEAREAFELADDGLSARQSMLTWEITDPARLVSVPPTWRNYLLAPIGDPQSPALGLMPWDSDSRDIWSEGICEGVAMGMRQADLLFRERLSRLMREYLGRLRFHTLAAQGIVSMPERHEGRLGIRIEGQRVNIDETLVRITAPGRFQAVEEWQPGAGRESEPQWPRQD